MHKKQDDRLSLFHIMPNKKAAGNRGAKSEIIEANPQIIET